MKMETDVNRFRKIVRGKIKENLKRFISSGELVGKQGDKTVSIPLPRIDLPHFRHGKQDEKGMGQGEGEVGDPVPGISQEGEEGQAGENPGEHALELEVSLEELADILGEELELPHIENKGKKNITQQKYKYQSILKNGPESLRNFKRTYKEALKRQISTGEYQEKSPIIIPWKEDRRYRSFKLQENPEASAVIIYMMDVSGSMGEEQKEIVRLTSFWINTWLKAHYKNLDTRFIIHDAVAQEVDEHIFFHTKESGGTLISSAYKMCEKIIASSYPEEEWNIYLFHFSDGDNWSGNDTTECLSLLENVLLPRCNLFAYGQVESRYGSGQFLKDLEKYFDDKNEKVILSQIKDKEGIMQALRVFLNKGK